MKHDKQKPPPPLKEAPKFNGLRKAFGEGQAADLAQASAVGFAFVVAILLGLALGWWLDKKFGTAPWLLLIGLLFGIIAGFRNLFKVSALLERRAKEAAAKPDSGQGGDESKHD